ncbi:MAG: hypothetical protein D6766_06680, partial [Verrucomicrobia bacterium]
MLAALGCGWLAAAASLPTEDPPEESLHPLLAPVIEQGPYRPRWESLTQHPLPAWYQRDKIGL